MRDHRRRLGMAACACALLASPLTAQLPLAHTEDASIPPRGVLRLRAATSWTRYDERFTASGSEPLGASFTADAFGSASLAALAPIESRVQSAAGMPFTLSLGHMQLGATGREEVVPLVLEYGVTRRLAVGVTVPIVRKRVAVQFRLDTAGGFTANVGPNASLTSTAARQTNATVQAEFATATSMLNQRIQDCEANPAGAGCGAVLAQGPALLQASTAFAADLAALYGTGSASGLAFVPIAGSDAQQAIAGRIGTFNAEFQSLLGTSATLLQAIPVGAGGPAGPANFQEFLTSTLGRDSLTTQERVGFGDVEVGFKFMLLDGAPTDTSRVDLHAAVATAVRLPTGSRQSPSDLVDLRLGDGSVMVDSRAMFDARVGRFGLLAVGRFATDVHDVDTTNLADRTTRWMQLDLEPRWHLSRALALHGAYTLLSSDVLGRSQYVGGGLSLTTIDAYRRHGGPLPFEMRFTHLEALAGAAGRPRDFRDLLELRVYYRLLR